MNEVIGHIQRSTYISRAQLDSQPVVTLANGTLELRSLDIVPHSPEFLSTIRVPVVYDPDKDCPRIRRFLGQIVPKDLVPLLEEIFGWCLDTDSRIQRAVLLLGEGANGKSTYLRLLRRFLGRRNCVGITLQSLVSNRFATSRLFGKLANIYPDLPTTKIRDAGVLKALTGGDAITAERKYERSFTFVNKSKQIFSSNRPPVIEDDSYAMWRRMLIMEFPYTFGGDQADKNLLKKLTTRKELSGLLNIALEALRRLRDRGDFGYSASWQETRRKYGAASDPIGVFVEEACEFDSLAEIAKEDLWEAYTRFCVKNGIPAGTKRGFGRIFKERFPDRKGERDGKWTGIRLAGPPAQ